MYQAIELWQESRLSQVKFCSRENISVATFGYWLRKYREEKELCNNAGGVSKETFIPVEVSGPGPLNRDTRIMGNPSRIEVIFPNGVRVSCPAGIDIRQLKTLIKF